MLAFIRKLIRDSSLKKHGDRRHNVSPYEHPQRYMKITR